MDTFFFILLFAAEAAKNKRGNFVEKSSPPTLSGTSEKLR